MIIDDQIKEISENIGVSEDKIVTILEDWAIPIMRDKGIVVKLSISRWRATKKIYKEEIGFDSDDEDWESFSKDYLKLGQKILFPKKILALLSGIENKARGNLNNYSVKTVWGYFLPYTAYEEWFENNELIKKEFFDTIEDICKNYKQHIEKTCDNYKNHADVLWEKRYKNGTMSYDEFIKGYLYDIRTSIPSEVDFKQMALYEEIFTFIPIPSDIEKDLLYADKILEEREDITREIDIKRKVAKEAIKHQTKLIKHFLDCVFGEMRGIVISVIEDVSESIKSDNGSIVTGRPRNKLLNMIEKVRTLDFLESDDVRDALDKLQVDLEKEEEYRSDSEVLDSLKELKLAVDNRIKNEVMERLNLI